MRALVIATLFIAIIDTTAFAQQKRNPRDMMTDMKAQYGQTFEQCQTLATSRGYRLNDDEGDSRAVAMFIEGCIMGKRG
jgi:hypothetical protein